MKTDSAYIDLLYNRAEWCGILNSRKYTQVIDGLRPTSTYTLDVSTPELAEIFVETGKKFKDYVKRAVFMALEDRFGTNMDIPTVFSNIKIEFTGLPTINMYDIKARKHENKMVTFDTVVIASDSPKSYTKEAEVICPMCGGKHTIQCTTERKLPTEKCDNQSCRRATMAVNPDSIITDDIQTIVMQEPMEYAKHSTPVVLIGKLIGTNVGIVYAGQRKRITGLFRSIIDPKKSENEIIIEVASVEDLENDDIVYPDELLLRKLENDSKEDGFLDKIGGSFAPHIYGSDTIKKSLLLTLVGGNTTTKKRGDTHILLVGDPSMAKSELLKFAGKVTQKSIYTSGRGASAAGLTIGIVKLTDGRSVAQAGVIPLCNEGFAMIDEFDKMSSDDRSAMHEAMEQQTVSIAKAGIRMTLPARTTIIAAANPKAGKYDTMMTLGDNLEVPAPLISRFDMIWLFTDKVHRDLDREKALHIIKTFTDDNDELSDVYLTEDEMIRYLNHARKFRPKLTKEVTNSIVKLYGKMRDTHRNEDNAKLAVGTRQLEAIVRLATAHAKLLLKSEVDVSDVEVVKGMLTESYESFGFDLKNGEMNQEFLSAHKSKDTMEMIARHTWYTLANSEGEVDVKDFLAKLSEEKKFGDIKAQQWFANWERAGIIKLNKNGTYRLG